MLDWLESSIFARLITQTLWGFPINEFVHILAISTVTGVTFALAANLWLGKPVAMEALQRYLRSFFYGGFAIAFGSGFLFFAAWPDRYLSNTAFWAKLPIWPPDSSR